MPPSIFETKEGRVREELFMEYQKYQQHLLECKNEEERRDLTSEHRRVRTATIEKIRAIRNEI